MKSLYILVMMQLKEQMNLGRYQNEKLKFFRILLGVVGTVGKFASVAALCFAFMYAGGYLCVGGSGGYIPTRMISFLFSVMLLMAIISCTVGLTKSLYYARDNSVLLTLPCTPIQVYLSKLIIFFVFEIKRNFSFLVPMFVAYFLHRNLNPADFSYNANPTYDNLPVNILWMILCIVIVSLSTVAIGAVLSIPIMWLGNFYRQHKKLQVTTVATTLVVAAVAFIYVLSILPEDFDPARDWSKIFAFMDGTIIKGIYLEHFGFMYQLSKLMLGDISEMSIAYFELGATATRLGVLMGITAFTLGLGFLMVRPLFYKMASTPFEYLKKSVRPKKNRERGKLFSSVYTNYLIVLKNSNEVFYNLAILLSTPMLLFILNSIFSSMDVSKNGHYMIISVNIMLTLLMLLNSNCIFASLFSRDGQSRYLIKTIPANYALPILTKMIPNMSFAVLSIVATSAVFVSTLPLSTTDTVLISIAILFVYIGHAFYSAELDLMNPKHQLYSSVGSAVSNPNEMKSTTWAFLISFMVAAAILLLLFEEKGYVAVKFIAVSAAALAYRLWSFFSTLGLYYKEK